MHLARFFLARFFTDRGLAKEKSMPHPSLLKAIQPSLSKRDDTQLSFANMMEAEINQCNSMRTPQSTTWSS
jgi:hypothetical protein